LAAQNAKDVVKAEKGEKPTDKNKPNVARLTPRK